MIESFFSLVVRQIVANALLHTKGALNNISLELSIHLGGDKSILSNLVLFPIHAVITVRIPVSIHKLVVIQKFKVIGIQTIGNRQFPKVKRKVAIYNMEGLALTIPIARNCPIDGLVLYEPVDANLLDKCIHSDLLKVNYTDSK